MLHLFVFEKFAVRPKKFISKQQDTTRACNPRFEENWRNFWKSRLLKSLMYLQLDISHLLASGI